MQPTSENEHQNAPPPPHWTHSEVSEYLIYSDEEDGGLGGALWPFVPIGTMLGASWTWGRITWSSISTISSSCKKQFSKHCTNGAAVKLLGFQAMPIRGSGKGICELWLVASFVASCVDHRWLYVLWVSPDILIQDKKKIWKTEQTKSGFQSWG